MMGRRRTRECAVARFEEITYEVEGDVAAITIDRPEALNAITPTMFDELNEAAESARDDASVRFVVLTGAGRAFSAGVDLKALGQRTLDNGKVGDILDLPARRFTGELSSMGKITIAKVNGFCFTGALELAMACDLIVAAEEAKLGDTHAKFGLRPTWGLSQRLPALVGLSRARLLSLTARTFTGAEAAEWGLAALAVPGAELDQAVTELIDEMRPNSPESFVAYKDLYRSALDDGVTDGLAYEAATDYPFTDTDERLADFR